MKKILERIDEQYLDFNENHLTCFKGQLFTGVGYVFFENTSDLEYETYYEDGHDHGLKRKWYESGQLEYEAHKFRGMGHGVIKAWHKNGQLKDLINAEYGITLDRITYNEQGEIVDQFKLKEGSVNHDILIKLRDLYKDMKS